MAIDYGDIRTALKSQLETISGLRVFDHVPDNTDQFPCAVVADVEILDATFGANAERLQHLNQRLFLLGWGIDAQRVYSQLDPFIFGPNSIAAALEEDETLGGVVEDVDIVAARTLPPTVTADIQAGGTEYEIRIKARVGS